MVLIYEGFFKLFFFSLCIIIFIFFIYFFWLAYMFGCIEINRFLSHAWPKMLCVPAAFLHIYVR